MSATVTSLLWRELPLKSKRDLTMGLSLPRLAFSLVDRASSARSFRDKADERGFTVTAALVFLSAVGGFKSDTLLWVAAAIF